jgi:hypothetical protein
MKGEQRIGRAGQNVAAAALSRLGVELVEEIGTPVRLVPAHAHRKDVFRVSFGEKVSGDHRGILPGGRSVLAETKTILDRNLRFSDLRDHQPGRLTAHADFGGLSLLVWVHQSGTYILQWPVPGFISGTGIDPDRAAQLNITEV